MNESFTGEKSQLFSRNSHMKPAFDFNVRRNLAFALSLESVPALFSPLAEFKISFLFFFPLRKYC